MDAFMRIGILITAAMMIAASSGYAESEDNKKSTDEKADLGAANVMAVELFYKENPKLTKAALLKELRTRLPKIEPLDGKEDTELKAFAHLDHQVTYADNKKVPAQCLICDAEKPPEFAKYKGAIEQSWSFPKCEETVKECKHTMIVTDFLASGLSYKDRFKLFRDVLVSTIKAAPPEAIYWQFSDHFTTPEEFLKEAQRNTEIAGVQCAFNVRLFRIIDDQKNDTGDAVMDTRGLTIFGLHDLQCHFRGLETGDVAGKLYNLGLYLYEKGDVIESGHTVQGLKADQKWKVQLEDSLVKPHRQVLDINPGAPNAAGKRK
jgi:hypothetical protein